MKALDLKKFLLNVPDDTELVVHTYDARIGSLFYPLALSCTNKKPGYVMFTKNNYCNVTEEVSAIECVDEDLYTEPVEKLVHVETALQVTEDHLKDIKNTNLYNTVLARKVYDAKDKIDIVLLQIRHSINGTRQYTVHSHCRGDDSISCGHYFEGDLQAAFDYYNNQDPKTTPASNIFDEWKSQAQKDNNLDEYLYHLSMKEKPLPYGQWKMKYNELKRIQAREDYKNGDPLPGNMERRSIDLCNQLGY